VKPPNFLTHSKTSPSAINLLFLLDEIINGFLHTNRPLHAGVIWQANFRYLKASGRPIIFQVSQRDGADPRGEPECLPVCLAQTQLN
jgi:hypothetical protein